MNIKITTLIEDNQDNNKELNFEHGLSLLIETDDVKILFDTGKTGVFLENAQKLNIDLDDLDYVILSHGHYDHTGGLTRLIKEYGNNFELVIGDNFFYEKYRLRENKEYKFIGNSFNKEDVKSNNINTIVIKDDMYELTEDIIIVTNFEKNNDFEKLNENLLIKKDNKYQTDKFLDEISLVLKTEKGLFVVVGCSHVGVANILETISKRFEMPIYGVLGGSHLIKCNEERLNKTVEYFRDKDIKVLAMSHCTGQKGIEVLNKEFSDRFIYNNTGNVVEIK